MDQRKDVKIFRRSMSSLSRNTKRSISPFSWTAPTVSPTTSWTSATSPKRRHGVDDIKHIVFVTDGGSVRGNKLDRLSKKFIWLVLF